MSLKHLPYIPNMHASRNNNELEGREQRNL